MRISVWSSDGFSSDLPERVRAMTRPVVTGAKPDVALVIPLFVVEAQRLAPRLRLFLVEGHGGHDSPYRLDPLHGRTLAHVRDHYNVVAHILERAFVRSEEHTSELKSLMRISYA